MKGTLYQCQVNESMGTLDLQGERIPHEAIKVVLPILKGSTGMERARSCHIKNQYSVHKCRYGTLVTAQLQNTMYFFREDFLSHIYLLPEMQTNIMRLPYAC